MSDIDALAPGCSCGRCGPACCQALCRPCCGACVLELSEADQALIVAFELQHDPGLTRLSGAVAVFYGRRPWPSALEETEVFESTLALPRLLGFIEAGHYDPPDFAVLRAGTRVFEYSDRFIYVSIYPDADAARAAAISAS